MFERPLSPLTNWDLAVAANSPFVRTPTFQADKMLHDARMAGLVKLRRSTERTGQWLQRAVSDDAI